MVMMKLICSSTRQHRFRPTTARESLELNAEYLPAVVRRTIQQATFSTDNRHHRRQQQQQQQQRRRRPALTMPTKEDIRELFLRMDSRPGSMVVDDKTETSMQKLQAYNQDWTKQYQGKSEVVVRPNSTEEVSKILEYCNDRRLGVVPQGGNTGLVGGSIPIRSEVILSLENMNKIHSFDSNSGILQAQSGCILDNLQDYTATYDHLVPIDLGASGTCQIGGNISTNAGGSYYYRYGSLHANTMGLEVVLPNGKILNLGYDPCHLKDNTGYDLKQLFIGAEGTLGIITNVALLCPRLPQSKCAAFLACNSYEEVYHTLDMAKSKLGEILAAFEFMDETILELVLQTHDSLSLPFEEMPSYSILVETHGSNEEHDREKLQDFVETSFVSGLVQDGAIAQNISQVQEFWKIRELCNPSVATQGYVYKYDVSLPVAEFDNFNKKIREGLDESDALCTSWGHVIDGNLHLNIVVPGQSERDDSLFRRLEKLVVKEVIDQRGSISAEHGLGQYKNKHMPKIKDAQTLDIMKQMKSLFDPKGIMNRGKYLP